jgi:hypothetical protein
MATYATKENHANFKPTKRQPTTALKPLTPVTTKRKAEATSQTPSTPRQSALAQENEILKEELQKTREAIELYKQLVESLQGTFVDLIKLTVTEEKAGMVTQSLRRDPKRVRLVHELMAERVRPNGTSTQFEKDYYRQKYEEVSAENEQLKANVTYLTVEEDYALSSAF